MLKYLRLATLASLVALAGLLSFTAAQGANKVRVLLVDGQNNHKWKETTPLLKRILEDSGRFTVDVTSHLKQGDTPAVENAVPFPPDLGKYDVVLSNYNGAPWPDGFNAPLEAALKDGKLGLVIVHAANNAFRGWKEYDQMIGMGWRDKKYGERLLLDDAGKQVRLPAGEGDNSGHKYTGPFTVTVRDPEHPVTKGMPREWLHARDELYDNMRGPIQNVHLLATAHAGPGKKGTGVHEPMIWTVSYGKGRVFHTPMGHDTTGMACVGFVATLQRGTEWAATGKVTLPLPKDFPTADKGSSIKAK